jgi:hypothetical protein
MDVDNLTRVFNGLKRAYSHSRRPGKWSTASEVDSWTQAGWNVSESLEILVKKGQAIKKAPALYRPKDGMAGPTGNDGSESWRSSPKDDRRSSPKTDDRRSDRKTDEDKRRDATNAAMMSILLDGSVPISNAGSAANVAKTAR